MSLRKVLDPAVCSGFCGSCFHILVCKLPHAALTHPCLMVLEECGESSVSLLSEMDGQRQNL